MLLKCEISPEHRKADFRGGGGCSRFMSARLDTGCRWRPGESDWAPGHSRACESYVGSQRGWQLLGRGGHLQSPSGLEPLTSSRLLSVSATVLREAPKDRAQGWVSSEASPGAGTEPVSCLRIQCSF